MALIDPYPFQLLGLSVEDVEEILEDLDYLYAHAEWAYTQARTAEMIEDSADIMMEFLRAVKPEAVRNAMLSRRIKRLILGE
jgi:hypothetical protein